MLILHDPNTLLHATVELLGSRLISALESPERLQAILKSLETSNHKLTTINLSATSLDQLISIIQLTHNPAYLKHIRTVHQNWVQANLIEPNESVLPECFPFPTANTSHPSRPPKDPFALAGFYAFDMSSGISAQSHTSILASANLAFQATQLLKDTHTTHDTIFALTRPPGHHCNGTRAGGYCYINNAAVAISTFNHHQQPSPLDHHQPSPVHSHTAILDLDFHHGNGTQDIFYTDPTTLYISIHGQDEFPYYTGSASESGSAPGLNTTLNLPLPTGSSATKYLETLETALTRIREFKPQFLLVSLGFDTFFLDPLGKFEIETRDYERIARAVREGVGRVKTLILLEGGYVVDRLGENVLSFLKGWEEVEFS